MTTDSGPEITLQTYAKFRPTGFDTAGLGADRLGIGSWYLAPVTVNRDSEALQRSNWRVMLRELGGESDTVQIHRFGHWACGWFEIIVIDPADRAKVDIAQQTADALEDYPIIDESDYSDEEWTVATSTWAHASIRDRVDYLQRARSCVFAARRDEMPSDDDGRLFELLAREH